MKNKYCFLILIVLFVFIIGFSVVCAADNQTTNNIQKISEKTNIEKQNTISVKEKKNKTTSKRSIKTASKKTTYKTTLNTPKQAETNQKINIKTVTKDNNGKSATGRILLRYNGKIITRQDIKNGQTSYTYKIPNKLGTNKIQAYYYKAGVLKTTTTKTITITKPVIYKTTLTTPTNPDINQKITIKTVTKDSNGKNAVGRILLRYNGKIITRQDIKNGQTSYTYKIPNKLGQNKIQSYYYKGGVLKTTTTKTIQVTKTLYVSPNGNDKQTGTITKPYKTIQKAIDKSQNGYTIKLLKGTYTNKNIPKTITINKNINIANNVKDKVTIRITKFQTIIDNRANTKITGINFDRSLDKIIVNRKNIDIINSNFTSNNRFNRDNDYDGYGYSVILNYGKMNIQSSLFRNNSAVGAEGGYGGAITSLKGFLSIDKTNFTSNYARYHGGAIYSQNTIVNIKNSRFINQIAGYFGGAVASEYGSNVNITSTYFYNNHARWGGAVYLSNSDDYNSLDHTKKSNMNIYKSTFDKNNVFHDGGAVVYGGTIYNDATLKLTNSMIKNSYASEGNGGAIYNTGNITITGTQITNNKATSIGNIYEYTQDYGNGGAIYSSEGNVNIDNSKINSNQAYDGGAIAVQEGKLTVTKTQLNNNKASIGGAISTSAPVTDDDYTYHYNININNCDINNNYANTSSAIEIGGNIDISSEGTLTIINSRIKNNKCPNYGNPYHGEGSYTLSNSYFVPVTIKNTQIINNSADIILSLSSNAYLQNNNIKNNKAEIIIDTTSSDAKINKCTIEANKATYSVIYLLIGQSEGTCNITKTNFINNNGLLIKYDDTENLKHMKIENNYWGSKNPQWNKILSGVKKPNKYYKSRV